MEHRWLVRLDDLGVSKENALRLVARMNDQEKNLPEEKRRAWELDEPKPVQTSLMQNQIIILALTSAANF